MRDIYVPSGSAMIQAFEAGRGMLDRRREAEEAQAQREARRSIGSLMASGNYAGAARAAYDAGDLNVGLQLQQRGEAKTLEGKKKDIRRQAATDPAAAAAAALELGDDGFYKDIAGLRDEAEKRRYGAYAAVIRSIGSKEPDQWDDEIAANRQQLEGLGIPGAEIDAFIAASPAQRTGMMAVLLQRADQFDKFQEEREKDRTFKATEADRKADNDRAERQLALSGRSVGIAAGNLAQRRAEHAARMAGKGGYAVPGASVASMSDEELLSALPGGPR